jgi:hypothetical protein
MLDSSALGTTQRQTGPKDIVFTVHTCCDVYRQTVRVKNRTIDMSEGVHTARLQYLRLPLQDVHQSYLMLLRINPL